MTTQVKDTSRISPAQQSHHLSQTYSSHSQIPSVSFMLWKTCNMRCKFCFAQWHNIDEQILPEGHLSKEESLQVVRELHQAGFQKVTFAGGEPTLCPWLFELVELAHNLGMITTIVTNSSTLTEEKVAQFAPILDWLGISLDSINPETNLKTGRAVSGQVSLTPEHYYKIASSAHTHGLKLKINTVVNQTNYSEDLSDFILKIKPQRWKVFQVLQVIGQNDHSLGNLEIPQNWYNRFLERHQHLQSHGITIVPEDNELMRGSYAQVDPSGRFYDDSPGYHIYSRPILEVGAAQAFQQVNPSFETFVQRGGIYQW
ncbi:MAG: viperin family antiviral radical SAM protein [Chroococcales cyanobacterium]